MLYPTTNTRNKKTDNPGNPHTHLGQGVLDQPEERLLLLLPVDHHFAGEKPVPRVLRVCLELQPNSQKGGRERAQEDGEERNPPCVCVCVCVCVRERERERERGPNGRAQKRAQEGELRRKVKTMYSTNEHFMLQGDKPCRCARQRAEGARTR